MVVDERETLEQLLDGIYGTALDIVDDTLFLALREKEA